MKNRLLTGLIAGAAVLATGFVAPSTANAGSAASGAADARTRVAVRPAVVDLLASAHIMAGPVGDATAFPFRGTVAFRFPVTGTNNAGDVVRHSGGVRLSSGHDEIALRRFRIDLGTSKVSAQVNRAGRVTVFTLGSHPNPDLGDVRLKLTGPAARALNSTFGVKAFAKGATFGFASVKGL